MQIYTNSTFKNHLDNFVKVGDRAKQTWRTDIIAIRNVQISNVHF